MILMLAMACNDDDVQNADLARLTQQVDALNALTERLESELVVASDQIAVLESDVSSNASLREDVVSNTSTIVSVSQRVSVLEASQDQQDSLLSELVVDVEANTSAILLARGDISDNSDAISSMAGDVADNSSSVNSNTSDIAALESELGSLDGAALTDFMTYVDVDTSLDTVSFSGANVYVNSGSGSTSGTVNGLGNLIVGYDEGSSGKTGSHNLILGSYHGYTSYGGLVGGYSNDISDAYASVIGGSYNEASGTTAVVIGGYYNDATGHRSAVLGGYMNEASGNYSTVTGSYYQDADGSYEVLP
jgi:hypothetical protein